MNDRKKILIGAAVSGILSVGLVSGANAKAKPTTTDTNELGSCYSPNACKTGADGKHVCGGKNSCNGKKVDDNVTQAQCESKGKGYRFEKNQSVKPTAPKSEPTAPKKQNKAENNADSAQVEQEADANVSDNVDEVPVRDPHE